MIRHQRPWYFRLCCFGFIAITMFDERHHYRRRVYESDGWDMHVGLVKCGHGDHFEHSLGR